MPASSGDLKISKEDYWGGGGRWDWDDTTWIVVKLTTGINNPMPCVPPGLCPNCGQTSCWRLDCCNFPRQGRPISQVPSSQSLGFPGLGDQRLIFPWDLSPQCSHRRPWEPPRIRVAGKWVTLADTEGVWFNPPCYNFLS